jgi:hypothetical protein
MSVLFPFLGVRLSTWLALAVFVMLAAWRSDRKPLIAGMAWLAGFEAVYQSSAMLIHTPSPIPWVGSVSISLVVGMPLVAGVMTLLGARPQPVLTVAAAAVFLVWIATGFHVSGAGSDWNVTGEILNELSKTLLAAAYLVPLLHGRGLEELAGSRGDVASAAALDGR